MTHLEFEKNVLFILLFIIEISMKPKTHKNLYFYIKGLTNHVTDLVNVFIIVIPIEMFLFFANKLYIISKCNKHH